MKSVASLRAGDLGNILTQGFKKKKYIKKKINGGQPKLAELKEMAAPANMQS